MIARETSRTVSIALADAICDYDRRQGGGLPAVARRAAMAPAYLEALVDAEADAIDPDAVEAIARVLGISPAQLREYRIALLLQASARRPDRREAMFLETLSPIERMLVADAEFSGDPLSLTVSRLLVEAELTQQELAEGIGLTQSMLSRLLNGPDRASMDQLEAIAQGLGAAPELFAEYRVKLIGEWLREHPRQVDALFDELNWEPTLAEYRAWQVRLLPDPAEAGSRALLESLLEIVAAEGPVMGARVYEVRLAASGLRETRDLCSLLNRATAAASRAGLLHDDDEEGDGTQKYRILRLPDQLSVLPRTLGSRKLCHVPPRELARTLVATSAWKRGESVPRLQDAISRTYGLSHPSEKDTEHLNRCITRARQGGNA